METRLVWLAALGLLITVGMLLRWAWHKLTEALDQIAQLDTPPPLRRRPDGTPIPPRAPGLRDSSRRS